MFFKIIVRKINLKYKYKKKQKFFYKFVYTTHVFAAKQESKIFPFGHEIFKKFGYNRI